MMGYIFRQVKALDDRMRAAAKLPCKTHPRFVKFEELMSENFVVRPTLGRPRKISSLKAVPDSTCLTPTTGETECK